MSGTLVEDLRVMRSFTQRGMPRAPCRPAIVVGAMEGRGAASTGKTTAHFSPICCSIEHILRFQDHEMNTIAFIDRCRPCGALRNVVLAYR